MSDAFPLSSSLAADVVLTLLHFLWQGILIAGAIWLGLQFADRARPTTRYAIVLAGGVLCAVAPLATLIGFRLAVEPGNSTQPVVLDLAAAQDVVASVDAIPIAAGDVPLLPMWQQGLLAAWCLGVLLMTGRLLIGWLAVQRLRRRTRFVPQDVVEMAAGFAARLGLRRLPRIAVSARVTEAMVVGVVRPMILLPAAWLTELPPDVLAAVVAHELAHVRRLDPWVNALQRIVETLLFYHPGVWWLSRRLRFEREFCCDELAVRITGQPLVYARTLELVAHRRLDRRIPALATGIGDRKMTLLKRVHNVLGDGREDRPRNLLTPLATVFVVMLGIAVYRTAWFSPATLADDEPRRDREVERSRRGDDDGERDNRRRERQSDDRLDRGAREDDEDERELRDVHELTIELEGDLSPEVRELIRDLMAQIDELRSRLRSQGGEMQLDVEARDMDRDGELDVVVEGRRMNIRREPESFEERREVELPEARIGVIEGRRIRIAPHRETEERAEDGERESEAGRLDDNRQRRFSARILRGNQLEQAEREEELREHREEQAERREEPHEEHIERREGLPGEHVPRVMVVRPPLPRVREEPERDGLATEVRELREQVRDLAELVGDLRESLRERDDDSESSDSGIDDDDGFRRSRGDDEGVFGGDRGGARGGFQQRFRNEFERRRLIEEEDEFRERSDEEASEGEAGEESAGIEAEGGRRYRLLGTDDGRVRVYVTEGGRDSVLEARIIELTPDGEFKLEDAESALDEESDDASGSFDEGESGIEADPFASDDGFRDSEDDATDPTDPFGNEDADGDADDGAADVTDDAIDPFAVDD